MVAAKYGRAAEVEYLILLGAFADSQDHSGTTPLMYACEVRGAHGTTTRSPPHACACPSSHDHDIAQHGDVPTVGMILKHTCGVNITNNHG